MKSFVQLTPRGQGLRLRQLAKQALAQYNLAVRDIRLVGLFTNAIFRLRTTDGHSYALRVCRPGWRSLVDLQSEMMWLQALGDEPHICAPRPIVSRKGDVIVEAQSVGVPESRRCVVMSWLPGTLLAQRLDEANVHKMGRLFAVLHEQGARFRPPPGFTERKMDSIYARDEQDVLFSDSCRDAFTAKTRHIVRRVEAQVKQAFADLYRDRDSLQVIHNDLHHDNIKVRYGRLCPFDFEDTIWGYPVQDIAMVLQDLMADVEPETYVTYQSAFRSGYESLKPWPEAQDGQIDTFRAGRMLWVTNYVARYERPYLRRHIDWLAPQFERYLDTGQVRKL